MDHWIMKVKGTKKDEKEVLKEQHVPSCSWTEQSSCILDDRLSDYLVKSSIRTISPYTCSLTREAPCVYTKSIHRKVKWFKSLVNP